MVVAAHVSPSLPRGIIKRGWVEEDGLHDASIHRRGFLLLLWWADKGIEPDVIRDLKSTEQGLTSPNNVFEKNFFEGERFPKIVFLLCGEKCEIQSYHFFNTWQIRLLAN